jgi:hypothetical protein
MSVSFPPRGKEFGTGDFCEPRLRLTSAAVKDANKSAFKAEKINTGPRPAMSSFAGGHSTALKIARGRVVLFYHCLHRAEPANQLERSSARPVRSE